MAKSKKGELTSGLVGNAGGLPLGIDLYSSAFGTTDKEAFSTIWELKKRLAELDYRLPTAHLTSFLGYARAGNVVGIRRPWPETFDAMNEVIGNACTIRPESSPARSLHLALLFSQFEELVELHTELKSAAKESTLKLQVRSETENNAQEVTESRFSELVFVRRFGPPEGRPFSVSSTVAAECQLIINWAVESFARMLEWERSEKIIDALQVLLNKPPVEVQARLHEWRKATELHANQNPPHEQSNQTTDTGKSTATSSLGNYLEPANIDSTANVTQTPVATLPNTPRVSPLYAGRCGQWVNLSLLEQDTVLFSVQIPIGLLRANSAALEASNAAAAKGTFKQWTEGYHYYTLQPLGSAQHQAAEGARLNWYFNRQQKNKVSSGVFRAVSASDAYSLDDEACRDPYRSGAIIFAPPWPSRSSAENRMSVHILRGDANKRKAMQTFFVDGSNRLNVWRIGKKNAVILAGYLSAQAYIHVDHKHSIGLHTTSAKSFFEHEWHEFRFVDQLKSLTITGAVAGSTIATLATGGAPLLIALVGLGVSMTLDPFAARITNASKQTKRREFILEKNRLRTQLDEAPSESSLDFYRIGVKKAEKALRKRKWTGIKEPPETALISKGNVPQDDVKDVGKLVRRAYVHLNVVRKNLESLEKTGVSNDQRDKLLGESLHHIEKTWRYLAPSVIFASAAYDVNIRIAEQWNKVYSTIEASLINRLFQLQSQKKHAWLLDNEKVAKRIMKWFKLDKQVAEPEIIGWRGLGVAGQVPVHKITDEKKRIIDELNGTRQIIDPATRKPISSTGDGRFSGTRTGYTTGSQVGSTLTDWLTGWDFESDEAKMAGSDDEKIDQLGKHISALNTKTATHLQTWGHLEVDESKTADQSHEILKAIPKKGKIQLARDNADNPSYRTKGKHYWSNWDHEKTKGQKIQVGFQKVFGFSFTFGSPLLTQGLGQGIKVLASASSSTFFKAGKALGKFATTRQGVKKTLKETHFLTTPAVAHSALKPTALQESALQQDEQGFNFDLLKAGSSFIGTSLIRKVAFRMYKAASTLNVMFPPNEQGGIEKRIVGSDIDELVDVMKELYEYHHHMDKLEFYLMGLLTYISILSDVAEAYEEKLLEKLADIPTDAANSLNKGLGNPDD
jgi:hypothetical protein